MASTIVKMTFFCVGMSNPTVSFWEWIDGEVKVIANQFFFVGLTRVLKVLSMTFLFRGGDFHSIHDRYVRFSNS